MSEAAPADMVPQRFGSHDNAFGLLRLLLASAVIWSHAAPLLDGNTAREPLVRLFGGETLGAIAVDAFFIISGYLITASYRSSRSISSYLVKRVARIYPAFAVASLLCLLVVAPLAGADLSALGLRDALVKLKDIATLTQPYLPNTFTGSPYPQLDGAMWTIQYEFRCYLLVIVLGVAGLLRRPWAVAALGVVLLAANALLPTDVKAFSGLPLQGLWLGQVGDALRMTAMFLAGAWFHLLGDRLRFGRAALAGAAVVTVIGLAVPPLTNAVFAVAGGYLILGLGFEGPAWARRVNNRNDVSYGVYLYGWPLSKLLIWYVPGISMAAVTLLTLAGALGLGAASWFAVEKPVLAWVRGRSGRAPSSSADLLTG